MRAAGLAGCHRRRARTTIADLARPPAPHLIGRDFAAPTTNRLWVGDSTSVPTQEGWLYLAILLDAYSRRVVGWAMADHLRAELAADALTMALAARRSGAGLVHHSDRGCQDTPAAYQEALAAQGIAASMSRAGDGDDNAMAGELLHHAEARTRRHAALAAARLTIFAWLEVWYNRQRRHSAPAYRSPVDFEEQHLLLQDLAAKR